MYLGGDSMDATYVQNTGHGRDVQTEQSTTDTCERTDNILYSDAGLVFRLK